MSVSASTYGIVFKGEAVNHQKDIMAQLLEVIDPELGIDFPNLGLIYEVDLNLTGECTVVMTLTTPACPLVFVIEKDFQEKLSQLTIIKAVTVTITFYPVWSIQRLSPFACVCLGMPIQG